MSEVWRDGVITASKKLHIAVENFEGGSVTACGRKVIGKHTRALRGDFDCKLCIRKTWIIDEPPAVPEETANHIRWAVEEMEPAMKNLAAEMAVMNARVALPGITQTIGDDVEMASRVLALESSMPLAQVRRSIRHHGRYKHIRDLRRRAMKDETNA